MSCLRQIQTGVRHIEEEGEKLFSDVATIRGHQGNDYRKLKTPRGSLSVLSVCNVCLEDNCMRTVSPHRDISHDAMPFCARHNRLFPHPFVGWLTPAGIAGLALIPARCDHCLKEVQRDDVLLYSWTTLSSPSASLNHFQT
jgi:hypothetical protein